MMMKSYFKILFSISFIYLSLANTNAQVTPEICMVTVDTPTNNNYIVWERPYSSVIDSYFIYKETTQANVYVKIGATAYEDLSVFIDPNSNPSKKAERYRITLLNTSGVESDSSSTHKTMHVSANSGTPGENNLLWSHYEGYSFSTYYIYRGTGPDNLQLLDSIQSNNNSYTDQNAPGEVVFYRIIVPKPDSCIPANFRGISSSGPYSQSLSNLRDYSAASTPYLTVSPNSTILDSDSGSFTIFNLYTNVLDWEAISSESWLILEKDTASRTIKATASTKNQSSNIRSAAIMISGTGISNVPITVIQNGSTGIRESQQNSHLRIYPNPFNNITDIYLPPNENYAKRLEILDIHGKVMFTKEDLHGNKITLSNTGLTKGMYFIKLTANRIYVEKVIVE